MKKTGIISIIILGVVSLYCVNASATIFYSNDFEGSVDLNLFSTTGPTLQVTEDLLGNHVLGSAEPFGSGLFNNNEQVSLNLGNVNAGWYNVQFDFFAIYTWDGDGSTDFGPDNFQFEINSTTLLNTFFPQYTIENTVYSYNSMFQFINTGNEHPNYGTGETIDVWSNNYLVNFLFQHTGGDLFFTFTGNTNQAGETNYDTTFPDEPWAIDNILVQREVSPDPVPEPSTILLLGTGLIGLTSRLRRDKKA